MGLVRSQLLREALTWLFVSSSATRSRRGEKVETADFFSALGSTECVWVRGRVVNQRRELSPRLCTPADEVGLAGPQEGTRFLHLLGRDGVEVIPPVKVPLDTLGFFDTLVILPGQLTVAHPTSFSMRLSREEEGPFLPGAGTCRLLPERYEGTIVVSDVDRTYLEADFKNMRALVSMLFKTGETRRTLEGMESFMKRLSAARPGGELVFLTGSPFFFKRTLEWKFELDALPVSALFTHPFVHDGVKELTGTEIRRFLRTLSNQFGHKLAVLLKLHHCLPQGARLVLLGDDSELDAEVYALFRRWTDGTLSQNEWIEHLRRHPLSKSEQGNIEEGVAGRHPGAKVAFIGIRHAVGRGLARCHPELRASVDLVFDQTAELEQAMKDAGWKLPTSTS